MNELRADLTNIPTSGRCRVTRTEDCIAMNAVKSYIRHDKQLFSCLDRKSE